MSETPSRRPTEVLSEYTISLPPKTILFDDDPYRNPQARSFSTVGSVDFAYQKAGYGMTHIPGTITTCHHPSEQPRFSNSDTEWYVAVADLNRLKGERHMPKPAPEQPADVSTPRTETPMQGAFTSILGTTLVDETYHLKPDGRKKRTRR